MPEVIFPLDSSKKFEDQIKIGHNRWHPEIPPAATVKPGDSFRVHCREWFDGAIVNDNSADDILNAPLKTVHKLSGPFRVEGDAMAGTDGMIAVRTTLFDEGAADKAITVGSYLFTRA